MSSSDELPLLDSHALRIGAPPHVVWQQLTAYVDRVLVDAERGPLARIWGTEPPSGFAVTDVVEGHRLTTSGRHRFSTYRLVFEVEPVEPVEGAAELRALSYAEFPGSTGRIYRALVIGSGAHVLATRRMLRAVRERAERAERAQVHLGPEG